MIELKPRLEVYLCSPRGFCAGVSRAIDTVEAALETYGPPVYVRHNIVHNRHVIEGLRARGAVFVAELSDIPEGTAPVIFSAHGVAQSVQAEAERRGMFVIDAACALVKKVHHEAMAYYQRGYEIILIGHRGHPEVVGILGQLPEDIITLVEDVSAARSFVPRSEQRLAYVTQTTLSVDDAAEAILVLQQRFPGIAGPRKSDICYATTNRQSAVKAVAPLVDAFIVIGSSTSSNSQRLREVAVKEGCAGAVLLEHASQIDWNLLVGVERLGVSAGASVPESLVEGLLDKISARFTLAVKTITTASEEGLSFALPRAVSKVASAS